MSDLLFNTLSCLYIVTSPALHSADSASCRYWPPTSHPTEASVPAISLWLTSSFWKSSGYSAPGPTAILILVLGLLLFFLPLLFQPREVAVPRGTALCPPLCSHLPWATSAMLKASGPCFQVHGSQISVSSFHVSQKFPRWFPKSCLAITSTPSTQVHDTIHLFQDKLRCGRFALLLLQLCRLETCRLSFIPHSSPSNTQLLSSSSFYLFISPAARILPSSPPPSTFLSSSYRAGKIISTVMSDRRVLITSPPVPSMLHSEHCYFFNLWKHSFDHIIFFCSNFSGPQYFPH